MGEPQVGDPFSIKMAFGEQVGIPVSMGNPHFVLFVDEFVPGWQAEASEIEHHHDFKFGTNVELVRVVNKGEIEIRIFERGVGETRSSGTGSCAAAVAAIASGRAQSPVWVTVARRRADGALGARSVSDRPGGDCVQRRVFHRVIGRSRRSTDRTTASAAKSTDRRSRPTDIAKMSPMPQHRQTRPCSSLRRCVPGTAWALSRRPVTSSASCSTRAWRGCGGWDTSPSSWTPSSTAISILPGSAARRARELEADVRSRRYPRHPLRARRLWRQLPAAALDLDIIRKHPESFRRLQRRHLPAHLAARRRRPGDVSRAHDHRRFRPPARDQRNVVAGGHGGEPELGAGVAPGRSD